MEILTPIELLSAVFLSKSTLLDESEDLMGSACLAERRRFDRTLSLFPKDPSYLRLRQPTSTAASACFTSNLITGRSRC